MEPHKDQNVYVNVGLRMAKKVIIPVTAEAWGELE